MSKAMIKRVAKLEAIGVEKKLAALRAITQWVSAHTANNDQYFTFCRVFFLGLGAQPKTLEMFGQPQADDQAIFAEIEATIPIKLLAQLDRVITHEQVSD